MRTCEVCGRELLDRQLYYCSMECRRKAEAERKKETAKAGHSYRRWVLRSPKGEYYKTDNLQAFMDDHPGFFPKPKTAIQLLYKSGGTAGWQVVSRETLDGHVDYPTPSRIRKFFRLRSPGGQIYEVTNVNQFLREHPEDFPKVNSAASALFTSHRFRGWTVLPNVEPSPETAVWHECYYNKHGPDKPLICRDCGREYMSSYDSLRCPECEAKLNAKRYAAQQQRKLAGQVRKIGSTASCERCGAEYTVTGGRQRYCDACVDPHKKVYSRLYQRNRRAKQKNAGE